MEGETDGLSDADTRRANRRSHLVHAGKIGHDTAGAIKSLLCVASKRDPLGANDMRTAVTQNGCIGSCAGRFDGLADEGRWGE